VRWISGGEGAEALDLDNGVGNSLAGRGATERVELVHGNGMPALHRVQKVLARGIVDAVEGLDAAAEAAHIVALKAVNLLDRHGRTAAWVGGRGGRAIGQALEVLGNLRVEGSERVARGLLPHEASISNRASADWKVGDAPAQCAADHFAQRPRSPDSLGRVASGHRAYGAGRYAGSGANRMGGGREGGTLQKVGGAALDCAANEASTDA
jgi:hypothetical protein